MTQTFSQLRGVEDDLFKALSAYERDTLYGLLSRVVEALAPGYDPPACSAPGPADCLARQDGMLSG